MAKKVKVDPITQAKQALVFFNNLKDAVKALDQLVSYNIKDIEKSLSRLEKQEEAELDKMENPAQPKMF